MPKFASRHCRWLWMSGRGRESCHCVGPWTLPVAVAKPRLRWKPGCKKRPWRQRWKQQIRTPLRWEQHGPTTEPCPVSNFAQLGLLSSSLFLIKPWSAKCQLHFLGRRLSVVWAAAAIVGALKILPRASWSRTMLLVKKKLDGNGMHRPSTTFACSNHRATLQSCWRHAVALVFFRTLSICSFLRRLVTCAGGEKQKTNIPHQAHLLSMPVVRR